jgi:hypothetical protein
MNCTHIATKFRRLAEAPQLLMPWFRQLLIRKTQRFFPRCSRNWQLNRIDLAGFATATMRE